MTQPESSRGSPVPSKWLSFQLHPGPCSPQGAFVPIRMKWPEGDGNPAATQLNKESVGQCPCCIPFQDPP